MRYYLQLIRYYLLSLVKTVVNIISVLEILIIFIILLPITIPYNIYILVVKKRNKRHLDEEWSDAVSQNRIRRVRRIGLFSSIEIKVPDKPTNSQANTKETSQTKDTMDIKKRSD